MMCEIKNVENKKSSFARMKDFFKEKFDKKVVKEKIKKVVAGGMITASLFMSRPVMAEDIRNLYLNKNAINSVIDNYCSEIIDVDLHGKPTFPADTPQYFMYHLPNGKKVLMAFYNEGDDNKCAIKVVDKEIFTRGEYICGEDKIKYNIRIKHIKDILFEEYSVPYYIYFEDQYPTYYQLYIDDENKNIIFVSFLEGRIKIIADNLDKNDKSASFEISLNSDNLMLYRQYVENLKKGIVDDNISFIIDIAKRDSECKGSPLECGGYKIIIKIDLGKKELQEEYLLMEKQQGGWNVIEYALNEGGSENKESIDWEW